MHFEATHGGGVRKESGRKWKMKGQEERHGTEEWKETAVKERIEKTGNEGKEL